MSRLVLGIEIGGTKLQLALGEPGEEPCALHRGRTQPERGAEGVLEWLKNETPSFLAKHLGGGETVCAIGVGFGGPVETATGRSLVSHQVKGWEGIPLKKWFEDEFGVHTVVANDSNAAGWGEYCRGAGRGTNRFFYMNIGSGIGGALVLDGKLQDGRGFGAGEIGHTYVPAWGDAPPDKLELLCSGWSIEKRVRALSGVPAGTPLYALCQGDPTRITCAMLGEAARQDDAIARAEIERVADRVGLAIANVITLCHPERIAMGGGVSLLGDVLIEPIRRNVDRYVFGPFRGRYEIVSCQLGEAVVLVGAMLLAAAEVSSEKECAT